MTAGRPERAFNFHRSRALLCGSQLLLALLILLDLTWTTASPSGNLERAPQPPGPLCCPEGSSWLDHSGNCSDGSETRINCANGFYSLDPTFTHFDEFSVVEKADGPHLEFLHDYDSVPANRFCVSGNADKGRWALVCFDDDADEFPPGRWKFAFFGVLSIISAIFLALTLMVYAVLPELRDIQDKAMASSVASLAISYFLLGVEQIRPHNAEEGQDIFCLPLAFLLYWSFLSAFFWMNLVSFNVWRTVWFKNFPIKDKDLFLIFCAIGLVGPGIFLLTALATHHTEGRHLKPHFGEGSCWFAGNPETWAFFYGPITVLLILNVIYLGLTCWRLWYDYRGYNGNGLRALRFNCLLYVKLILVMGITWIFEIISFACSSHTHVAYWIVTDIVNDLQGVIIFILLVPCRRRVKMLLARRKPFGITFPKSWTACDEEDETAYALPVEVELSNAP